MNHITQGSGDGICLVMHSGGLGDAIHATPAISVLAQSQSVTVIIPALQHEYWQYLADEYGVVLRDCSEPIDFVWLEQAKLEFAEIYSLFDWCTWEMRNDGPLTTDTIGQFAGLIGVELPEEFSWAELFGITESATGGYVLTSFLSNETWRTYSRASEANGELRNGLSVESLGPEQLPFAELVNLVHNARCVVAVDNGILALATALGKPTVSLWSVTEPEHIVNQFERFLPVTGEAIQGPTYGACESPCYRQKSRGFDRDAKENKYCCGEHTVAWCLHHITPKDILKAVEKILTTE